MTGSGKTGLGIDLIEEAAIDGIPTIAVDPKGDLGNLLLTFPGLRPPTSGPGSTRRRRRRKGVTAGRPRRRRRRRPGEGARRLGRRRPDRIARLRDAADFAIYTPGSDAGLPLSVAALAARRRPPRLVEDGDAAQRADHGHRRAACSPCVGIDADPLTQPRAHPSRQRSSSTAWRQAGTSTSRGLIRDVQTPPFDRVGIVRRSSRSTRPKERFELAMTLNNLLAAPGLSRAG